MWNSRKLDGAILSEGVSPHLLLLVALFLVVGEARGQDLRLAPDKIQFGRVATSKTRAVKIQNKGSSDLVVTSIQRCAGTSEEFSHSPLGATIAARKSADLEVTYTPTGSGEDDGCLEIASNDPDRPVARLGLSGAGPRDADEGSRLRLRPDSLAFGKVAVGDFRSSSFLIQVNGSALGVTVERCNGTSGEFDISPAQVTVQPGRGARIAVDYGPVDLGEDKGCLSIRNAADPASGLDLGVKGEGVDTPTADANIDLDIHDFKVKKQARLKSAQTVKIQLWVKNAGEERGPVPAVVIGTQNLEMIYEEILAVDDRPGNEGVAKYTFPAHTPTATGDIVWTVTLEDDDPDEDTATAVTRVIGEPSGGSNGVDLDVRRFRTTSSVSSSTGAAVKIRLAVENNGDLDEARDATLVGMQGGVEVYSETLSVADGLGDRGATNYRFPSYQPNATGEIVWMLVVLDDDPDLDEAFAVTRVLP